MSPRPNVPKIVDWYMNGKIEIDPIITHVMVGSKDLDAFRRCYDALFAAIGGNPAGNELSGRRKAA
jgi:hypothetical protein